MTKKQRKIVTRIFIIIAIGGLVLSSVLGGLLSLLSL